MANESESITIVGGGLAGLRAAYTLEQFGYSPLLLEASDRLGGRVKSDHLEGYTLDHGFQIVLSSYTEIFSLLTKQELELGYFPSGAMIQHGGEWITLLNPIRDPERLVFGKEPFFFDFLKLSKLYLKEKLQGDASLPPDPKPLSTWDLFKNAGISDAFIEEAVRPFFTGVFFDPDLFTSSLAFLRIFRFFIEGKAGFPRKGIETLPLQIAGKLKKTEIRLNTPVTKIEKGKIHLQAGTTIDTQWIILALDLRSASAFIPPLAERSVKPVACLYYAVDEGLFEPAPFLYLNADRTKPINNFSFNNLVQLSYAPKGKLLVSATVTDPVWHTQTTLTTTCAEQLSSYFNTAVNKWEHLKTYTIPHALPDQARPPLYHGKYCYDREKKIYLCGETVDPPSFQDALASGRKVAETLHAAISERAN